MSQGRVTTPPPPRSIPQSPMSPISPIPNPKPPDKIPKTNTTS